MSEKIITAIVTQDSPQTVSIELREQVGNTLIGHLEATIVPLGARVEGWHGENDEQSGQLVLWGERA